MIEIIKNMTESFFDSANDSSLPLYARLKRTIVEKISHGEWHEQQQLPSESEIVKALGVSRMTANRALRELTTEGVLVRRQGLGTFVAEKKAYSALFEVHNIADEISSRGHQHRAELVKLEQGKASAEEAINLGVKTSHDIFRSTVLHFENDLPIQLEDRVVNASLAPDYDKQDFVKHTAHDYLMKVAVMTEGEHLVEALIATEIECQLLQISADEPCLQIKRRTWSGEQLVATAKLLSPGSRFQLFGHFGR